MTEDRTLTLVVRNGNYHTHTGIFLPHFGFTSDMQTAMNTAWRPFGIEVVYYSPDKIVFNAY